MKKIIYNVFALMMFFIVGSNAYSQDMVFLESEDAYVSVVEYTDWETDNSAGYAGRYEFIYPGQTPQGEYAGDIFQEKLIVSFDNNTLNLYKNLIVESDWQQNDTLKNASISSNQLIATDTKGRFVTLTYKDKNANVKSVKGVVLENPESKELSFYQKLKD